MEEPGVPDLQLMDRQQLEAYATRAEKLWRAFAVILGKDLPRLVETCKTLPHQSKHPVAVEARRILEHVRIEMAAHVRAGKPTPGRTKQCKVPIRRRGLPSGP